MDLESGKFTAPRTGTYHFAFTGNAFFIGTSSYIHLRLGMYLNGNLIGSGDADEVTSNWQYDSFSLHSTLSLQAGDQIWLEIFQMSSETILFDNLDHYNHFSGWLLEENIFQLL